MADDLFSFDSFVSDLKVPGQEPKSAPKKTKNPQKTIKEVDGEIKPKPKKKKVTSAKDAEAPKTEAPPAEAAEAADAAEAVEAAEVDPEPAKPARPAKIVVKGPTIMVNEDTDVARLGTGEEDKPFDWSVFDGELPPPKYDGDDGEGLTKKERLKREKKEARVQAKKKRRVMMAEAHAQLEREAEAAVAAAKATEDDDEEDDEDDSDDSVNGEGTVVSKEEAPGLSRKERRKLKLAKKLDLDLANLNASTSDMPKAGGRGAAIFSRWLGKPIFTDGTGRHKRTVFVGNIPPSLAKAGFIRDVFDGIEHLLEVRAVDRQGGDYTGPKMAYCEFSSVAAAEEACKKNGYDLGGNALRINMADDKGQRMTAIQKKCKLNKKQASTLNSRVIMSSQKRIMLDAQEAGKSGKMKDILKELKN